MILIFLQEYHLIWQSVLEESDGNCVSGTTIYVSIGGYRYDDTSELISDNIREYSGPYFSPCYTLNVTLPHNYSLESVDENYHKQVCGLWICIDDDGS